MNELKFLEIMGKIDDDLIKEADEKPVGKQRSKPIRPRQKLYAACSVAAAAVITVGSVAFYNAHKPSDLMLDNSVVQPSLTENSNDPQNNDIPNLTEEGTTEKTNVTDSVNDQTEIPETVTTAPRSADSDLQIEHSDDSTPSERQTGGQPHVTTQEPKEDMSADDDTQPRTQTTEQPQFTTQEPKEDVSTDTSGYYYQLFAPTVDPYSDAYGADELPIVSIVISGNYYYQLDSSEHPAQGISADISDSDFGAYIGNVVELYEYDDPAKYVVSSKEPNLSGADVFYYAPANSQAVIIVRKGQQCSIFVFNGMAAASDNSSVYADTFRMYGAYSAEDIEYISYSIAVPNGAVIEVSVQGTITDREKINTITDVLFQLKPESGSNGLSGSPDWFINAWAEYKANPDAYTREDITFDIVFKNGTVLKDINYQPYIGNGYVEGMQELTLEDNVNLRQAFD